MNDTEIWKGREETVREEGNEGKIHKESEVKYLYKSFTFFASANCGNLLQLRKSK
jgi:hypothetical protein